MAASDERKAPCNDDYPFVVNIMRRRTNIHHRTGALITSTTVVVPASSIKGSDGYDPPEPNPLLRVGNTYILGSEDREHAEFRGASEVFVHPGFRGNEMEGYINDIALLVLNESISEHTSVRLAETPCPHLKAVGWFRRSKYESPAIHLQQIVGLQPIDCKLATGSENNLKGMTCLHKGPSSTCAWDRGALLLCSSHCGDSIVGLATYESQQYCSAPFGYTYLHDFKEWIESDKDARQTGENKGKTRFEGVCQDFSKP